MSLVTTRVPPSLAGPQPLHHIFSLGREIILTTLAKLKQVSYYSSYRQLSVYVITVSISLTTKTTVSKIVTLSCSVTKS